VVSDARAHSLASFHATDLVDDLRRRRLPQNAIVLAHDPGTIFLHYGGEAEERLRPDVTLVPVPLLPYPGMVNRLLVEEPALLSLLRGYLYDGVFRVAELQSLAAQRPVLIELDPRVPKETYPSLVPEGLLYRVIEGGMTKGDERQAALDQERAYDALYARLGAEVNEPQTRALLLWRHYHDALYYAAVGHREAARAAVKKGLARQPLSRELNALAFALRDERAQGPLDITPFLPGS
jgi:hypothetical protein